jgi:hypothetical protein
VKICYTPRNFAAGSLALIEQANVIIEDYQAQGYVLTLRQLYYQFVSKDLIPNTVRDYKRLGSVVNDARLAGLISWEAIEDRTRNLSKSSFWTSPQDILNAAAASYRIDLWETQPNYVEVWIEKEALAGVFERACAEYRIPFFSCRGYVSQSELWSAGMRLAGKVSEGKTVRIFHFGDHDPSGIDMSRDIDDRLNLFMGDQSDHLLVDRLALNMDQVREHEPPPNPAKDTDARFEGYRSLYGDESWELDALNPTILSGLLSGEVERILRRDAWDEKLAEENRQRRLIQDVADNFDLEG